MHWGGKESDRLTEEQVRLHKAQLRRLTDEQLLHSYGLYLKALEVEEGKPPNAAMCSTLSSAGGSCGGGGGRAKEKSLVSEICGSLIRSNRAGKSGCVAGRTHCRMVGRRFLS